MANTFQDKIDDRKEYATKTSSEFYGIFRVSLSRFFNLVMGFDIVAFDEWLKVPNGTSTAEHIREKYGARGVEIVKALL